MPSTLKLIPRTELCVIEKSGLNANIISWALSSGLNAIYIEEDHQLLGYLPLSPSVHDLRLDATKIITNSLSITFTEYEQAPDKNIFFQKTSETYLPIAQDHQLIGELTQILPSKPIPPAFWKLIDPKFYKDFLSSLGKTILFSTLNEKNTELYTLLKDIPEFTVSIYDPTQNKNINSKYDTVLFYTSNHFRNYLQLDHTHYLTHEYLYYELLAASVFDFFKENQISYYYVQIPPTKQLPPALQQNILPLNLGQFAQNPELLSKCYGLDENINFFKNGDYKKVATVDHGIRHCLKDCTSETYNVIDGKRITIGNPIRYINTIHCFGPCIVRGGYVNDQSTIPSYLQNMFNAKQIDWLRVLNYGVEGGINSVYDFHNMITAHYKPGDIVIHFGSGPHNFIYSKYFPISVIDPISIFSEDTMKHACIIGDIFHLTPVPTKLLAKYIFNFVEKQCVLANTSQPSSAKPTVLYPLLDQYSLMEEFEIYKSNLTTCRIPNYLDKKIGAIVMNCNPFTLGHLYLIEESSKAVDFLYVFIVEEDKSFFTFKERYQLAQACCTHLKNVMILPSGKYILSAMTFPEYFFKESQKEIVVNPIKDIELFGREIAPILNICIRFVGEEPFDKVTAQYNTLLKEKLGDFGISVVEIPRKCHNGTIISASYVRQLIKADHVTATKEFVPPQTYLFLQRKFNSPLS